jgi:hypothetical protein
LVTTTVSSMTIRCTPTVFSTAEFTAAGFSVVRGVRT